MRGSRLACFRLAPAVQELQSEACSRQEHLCLSVVLEQWAGGVGLLLLEMQAPAVA